MLNALPTPTPATGQPAKLLPSLAADAPGQRAATEARQGFAALMQQQADLHLADLRAVDLKSADLKQADLALACARNTDSRPADPAPARSTTSTPPERSAARQEPNPSAARATASTGSPAKPAEHAATPASRNAEPGSATRAAGQAPDNSAAHADAGQEPATADAADPAAAVTDAAQRPTDDTLPLADAATDPALADAAAASQAATPLRGRGPGLPGAAAADSLPLRRLPRTPATEAATAAARLAAALAPQPAAQAAEAPAGDTPTLDGETTSGATAEPGATPPNPDPATLQPWLQAQAMVTHWRPVGDGAPPAAGTDPTTDPAQTAATTLDALATAEAALADRGPQAQRAAVALAADRRAADAATQALATPAADVGTEVGIGADGALPGAAPALPDSPRTAAADLHRANDGRTLASPVTGQRAAWRPEAEQARASVDPTPSDTKAAADRQAVATATDSAGQPALAQLQLPASAAPATPGADGSGPADTSPAPAASALLAAGGGAGAARGLAEAAGARSGNDRPGATRADRRGAPGMDGTADAGNILVGDGPTDPHTTGPDTNGPRGSGPDVSTGAVHPQAGERPGLPPTADARAEALVAGTAKHPDTPTDAGTDPARAAQGALPATAGVQAPAPRGEAPGRPEPLRAEALSATALGGPAAGSPTLPQGGAPVAQVNTAFASQLAAATAAPVQAEARIAAPLDSPDFAPALGAQISLFTRDGVQTARLQLNPAEMGPISVQIALDGSAARVDFQADVAATREVIEASLPALAGALQDAGLTLAGGGVFQHAPGQQPQPEGQAAQQARGTGRTDNAPAGPQAEAAAPVVVRSRGLVDLVA